MVLAMENEGRITDKDTLSKIIAKVESDIEVAKDTLTLINSVDYNVELPDDRQIVYNFPTVMHNLIALSPERVRNFVPLLREQFAEIAKELEGTLDSYKHFAKGLKKDKE